MIRYSDRPRRHIGFVAAIFLFALFHRIAALEPPHPNLADFKVKTVDVCPVRVWLWDDSAGTGVTMEFVFAGDVPKARRILESRLSLRSCPELRSFFLCDRPEVEWNHGKDEEKLAFFITGNATGISMRR